MQRILPLIPAERLRILTGEHLAEPILAAVPELGVESLLLEPRARGTAPVLAWAAHEIVRRDPAGVMISLHADHVIAPDDAFRALLASVGRRAMIDDRLFTIGIEPTRAETGYGYIKVGKPLSKDPALYEVASFVEKPSLAIAEKYLNAGDYLWNSGIFIWRAATLLEEMRRHTPELAALLPILEAGDPERFFREAPNLSIDEGLLERSDRVAVARATFSWDDVGAWDAVARTRSPDSNGNIGIGDSHLIESEGCIAWAEEGSIVIFGARDLVVVRSGGITFVAPREKTSALKEMLQQLPERLLHPEI